MFKKFLAIIVFQSFVFSGMAVEPAKELTQLWQGISTYQASFEQFTFNPATGINQESFGKMKWLRPEHFLWKITSPNNQTIVLKGNELWIYDNDLEQVTVQPFDQGQTNSIVWLFNASLEQLEANFSVERFTEGNKVSYLLKPLKEDALFAEVQLRFIAGELVYLSMLDPSGQVTEITFKDLQLNKLLNNSEFDVAIPEGFDVLDSR